MYDKSIPPVEDNRRPVDFAQFIGAIRQVGLYRLVLNEVPLNPARG